MNVVGAQTLLSWKRAVTKEALRMYEAAAMALLRLHRGYMVRDFKKQSNAVLCSTVKTGEVRLEVKHRVAE